MVATVSPTQTESPTWSLRPCQGCVADQEDAVDRRREGELGMAAREASISRRALRISIPSTSRSAPGPPQVGGEVGLRLLQLDLGPWRGRAAAPRNPGGARCPSGTSASSSAFSSSACACGRRRTPLPRLAPRSPPADAPARRPAGRAGSPAAPDRVAKQESSSSATTSPAATRAPSSASQRRSTCQLGFWGTWMSIERAASSEPVRSTRRSKVPSRATRASPCEVAAGAGV